MGQKVHPNGIRLGIVKDHQSVWYADKSKYGETLLSDLKARAFLLEKLKAAQVSGVRIERPAANAKVTIATLVPAS